MSQGYKVTLKLITLNIAVESAVIVDGNVHLTGHMAVIVDGNVHLTGPISNRSFCKETIL
jgi:hypothetical protein